MSGQLPAAALYLTVVAEAGAVLAAATAVPRPDTAPARAHARLAVGTAAAALLMLPGVAPLPLPLAVVLAAAILAVPFLPTRFALLAGPLVVGTIGGVLTVGGWAHVALGVAQAVAATIWLGSARGGYPARLVPVAAVLFTVAWGGMLYLDRALPILGDNGILASTALRGTATVVCLALLVPAVRGSRPPGRVRTAGVAGLVILAAAGTVWRPALPPPVGVPVLASVLVGGEPVPVLVAPGRPGPNLVHLGSGAAAVGVDPGHLVPATTRPGTGNTWAVVDLPPGRSRLWVGDAGRGGWLTIDAGTDRRAADLSGTDGPECASEALGGLLSGADTALLDCPADRLDPADAASLRATLRYVAARGVASIGLVQDASPRATQAAGVVRDEARHLGIAVAADPVGGPLFVVSGWATGYATVRDVGAGRIHAQGTYLAPWLLNAQLLDVPAGQLLPLRFGPRDQSTLGYRSALGTRFPGEPPSAAGYQGWCGGGLGDAPVRLYAATRVFVPGDPLLSVHAHHSSTAAADWLPQGTVVPVTDPLPAA